MKKWIIKGICPDKTEFYISKHGNILSTNEQIWSDEAFTLKVRHKNEHTNTKNFLGLINSF
jgi:hypothetical protein